MVVCPLWVVLFHFGPHFSCVLLCIDCVLEYYVREVGVHPSIERIYYKDHSELLYLCHVTPVYGIWLCVYHGNVCIMLGIIKASQAISVFRICLTFLI